MGYGAWGLNKEAVPARIALMCNYNIVLKNALLEGFSPITVVIVTPKYQTRMPHDVN